MESDRVETVQKYRPEIDGLRALAVIPVILFHMGWAGVPGGYLGVDVFFVISGYLITGIIVDKQAVGGFSYSEFWIRRARRILPALLVMVIGTCAAAVFLTRGNDTQTLGKVALAAILSVANVILWKITGDYWGEKAENQELLHTWSLSVEEQFYFLFPLLLLLGGRIRRLGLGGCVAIVAACSLLLHLLLGRHYVAMGFYLLPTRAWELGVGSLLAIWSRHRGPSMARKDAQAWLGIGLIGLAYVHDLRKYVFVLPNLCTVVGAFLFVKNSGAPGSKLTNLVASVPMRAVGKVSYSLYLWHWPVIVVCRNLANMGGNPLPVWAVALLITILGLASYHLIEKPLRFGPHGLKPILALAAVALCVAGALCVFSRQVDLSRYNPVEYRGNEYDATKLIQVSAGGVGPNAAEADRSLGTTNRFTEDGVSFRSKPGPMDLVVLGDSHAMMWAHLLHEYAAEQGQNIAFFAANGTSPFLGLKASRLQETRFKRPGDVERFNRLRYEKLVEWRPRIVLVLTRWTMVPNAQATEELFEVLDSIGSRVLTIQQPPELFFGDRKNPAQLAAMGLYPEGDSLRYVRQGGVARWNEANQLIEELERRHSRFRCIRIADIFEKKGGSVLVLKGRDVIYVDDDHLSGVGTKLAFDRVAKALGDALRQ